MDKTSSGNSLLTLSICLALALGGCGIDRDQPAGNGSGGYRSEEGKISDPQALPTGTQGPQSVSAVDAKKLLASAGWARRNQDRSVAEALTEMQASYRLRPDTRFIKALQHIHALTTGNQIPPPETRFSNGKWSVSVNNETIGSIKQFPTFAEQIELAVAYANRKIQKSHIARKGLPTSNFEMLAPRSCTDILKHCADTIPGKPVSAEQLFASKNALLSLNAYEFDQLEVADELRADAMAVLALCESLDKTQLIKERALLSSAMGYYAESCVWIARLQKNDVIRLFLERDDKALEKLIASDKSGSISYLCLAVLAQSGRRDDAVRLMKKETAQLTPYMVPTLSIIHDCAAVESYIPIGQQLMSAVNQEIAASRSNFSVPDLNPDYDVAVNSAEWFIKDLLKEFEDALSSQYKADAEKPFSKAVCAYYRGHFYSAIAMMADSYFKLPRSHTVIERFASSLHTLPNSPSHEVELWLKHRLQIKSGQRSGRDLKETLANFQTLGMPAMIALFNDSNSDYRNADAQSIILVGKALFEKGDGRPSSRLPLSAVAGNFVLNEMVQKELRIAARKAGEPSSSQHRAAHYLALWNCRGAEKMASDHNVPLDQRLDILNQLQSRRCISQTALAADYQLLAREYPKSWKVIRQYSVFLIGQKQVALSVTLLKNWQKLVAPKSSDPDGIAARCLLARAYLVQNKPLDGLRELGEKGNTEERDFLLTKVQLLDAAGKKSDCEQWAGELLARYPTDCEAITTYASILWKNKKNTECARMLTRHRRSIRIHDWRYKIAPCLLNALGKSRDDVIAALYSLRDEGIEETEIFVQFAIAADRYVKEDPELAFQIISTTKASSRQLADDLIFAYGFLKRARGQKAALDWLGSEVALPNRLMLAPYAFEMNCSELLWNFMGESDRSAPGYRELMLYRVASSLYMPLDQQRKTLLARYFQSAPGTDGAIGRHLMSLSKVNGELLRQSMSHRDLCKVAFYLGYKAFIEGKNIDQDSQWYLLAAECGEHDQNEYRWSWYELGILLGTINSSFSERLEDLAALKVTPDQRSKLQVRFNRPNDRTK